LASVFVTKPTLTDVKSASHHNFVETITNSVFTILYWLKCLNALLLNYHEPGLVPLLHAGKYHRLYPLTSWWDECDYERHRWQCTTSLVPRWQLNRPYRPSINLLVTRCTNKFNIQQWYVLPTLYLCVL
jgi:hypothetical protein